jgi:hypothetical protein
MDSSGLRELEQSIAGVLQDVVVIDPNRKPLPAETDRGLENFFPLQLSETGVHLEEAPDEARHGDGEAAAA